MNPLPWTPEDDQKLMQAAADAPPRQGIARLMALFPDRSSGAISCRLSVLRARERDRGVEHSKMCPRCGRKQVYCSRADLKRATSENRQCDHCRHADVSVRHSGAGNYWYGKTLPREMVEKTRQKLLGRKISPEQNAALQAGARRRYEEHGAPVPFAAIRRKLGDEGAEQYIAADKVRRSECMRGSNNHMYGKPSPTGSGNGWKSWYREIHFRSLRELQYYINTVEIEGRSCQNIHMLKGFRVPYTDFEGTQRTYCPDFLVDGRIVVEIKPVKLWNTRENVSKREAAITHFAAQGLDFQFIDVLPDSAALRERYLRGEIRFVHKYIDRFEQYAKIPPSGRAHGDETGGEVDPR